ncbi:MAG: serine hydrolase [Maricaulaceae bacterium]
MRVGRFVLTILAGFAVATAAQADRVKYASFVIDADSGDVLHARRADELRYPASITKVMTLYMLFDAIEAEKIALDDPIQFSRSAAAQPPSKLGIPAGGSITVEQAIGALVVKSANDVAYAVGETLAGSETAFADGMTRRARALGMTRTRFKNASGLPNPDQVTTARDIARLTAAIRRDFPEHYKRFSMREFRFKGRTYTNHNKLLGRVEGVDGVKTGYINASGFNLAASAKRDGHRIDAVVFGGRTGASRNAHMTELIEAAFKRIAERGLVLARAPSPRLKPGAADDPLGAVLIAAATPAEAPTPGPSADDSQAVQQILASLSDALGAAAQAEGPSPVVIPPTGAPAVEADAPHQARPQPLRRSGGPSTAAATEWAVQIGAFRDAEQADALLMAIADMQIAGLERAEPIVQNAEQGAGDGLYRARFAGLSRSQARAACQTLTSRGSACLAVPSARSDS